MHTSAMRRGGTGSGTSQACARSTMVFSRRQPSRWMCSSAFGMAVMVLSVRVIESVSSMYFFLQRCVGVDDRLRQGPSPTGQVGRRLAAHLMRIDIGSREHRLSEHGGL